MEVDTKELDGGHQLIFMKFSFQFSAIDIKALVLKDKAISYQVLQQNCACVFQSRIFNIPALPVQVYINALHFKKKTCLL